jgi:cysteine desulfurase / selenocysteine lyase
MSSSDLQTTGKLNLYFDNSATSWPKPEKVYTAAEIQMRQMCGNPGRSGHTRTLEADRLIYKVRCALADLFNINDPARIIFTLNATDALNLALKGYLNKGDHVLYTALDHNSVLRPLGRLRQEGLIQSTMIPCSVEGQPDLDFLETAYLPNTSLFIINHASNVVGTIAPLEEMVKSAHRRGVKVLVDAAQTAGAIPIDIQSLNLDLLAFTGHKCLLGPTGTGGLYVKTGIDLKPLREGGTGSQSELDQHPLSMPERLESGTLNSSGLAGLLEGINFIQETGLENIRKHESNIRSYLYNRLLKFPKVKLFGPADPDNCAGSLSFKIADTDCGEIGYLLENNYGILCRTGLHCAPLVHRAINTFPEGTVRLSPGYFTCTEDIDYLVKAIEDIIALI